MIWLLRLSKCYICCLLWVMASVANAANIAVNPVHVYIIPHESTTVLKLANLGDQPALVQSSIVKWTQEQGKDVFIKTTDLLATPPIMSIAPHDFQLVRIGLTHPVDIQEEKAYRIFLKEVATKTKDSPGVHMVLEISVPVFVSPIKEVKDLQWKVNYINPHSVKVELVNNGNSHIQIGNFKFYPLYANTNVKQSSQPQTQKSLAPFFKQDVFNYLQPHQKAEWTFQLAKPLITNELKMVVITDKGEISENVTFASP